MCGRYTMKSNPHAVAALCNLPSIPELKARFNIAPTQLVPVVRATHAGRELTMLRWGLIPSWAKDPKIAHTLINARSETAAEKPSFRTAFRPPPMLVAQRRILRMGESRQAEDASAHSPAAIKAPFAFAGLWECWRPPDGDPIETCTILTTRLTKSPPPITIECR